MKQVTKKTFPITLKINELQNKKTFSYKPVFTVLSDSFKDIFTVLFYLKKDYLKVKAPKISSYIKGPPGYFAV